jgi:phosphocarrier protein HPr
METLQIKIINKLGLHARAASKLSSTCARFTSKIAITKDGKTVDGKSIMSLMLLAAPIGTVLDISCTGVDEAVALKAIVDLINNRFDEAE